MSLAGLLLGALAGLVTGGLLGLTGAGGSVLTLPALVAIVGLTPHQAVAASLVSVGATALTGLFEHARRGDVAWKQAAGFAVAGAAGAVLGGRFGRLIPGDLLMVLFGGLMLLVAARMAWSQGRPAAFREGRRPEGAGASRRARELFVLVASGAGVGLLSGTLGVGGGFLIVPALVAVVRISMRAAIATSLLVVAINALCGLAGAFAAIGELPLLAILPFVLASLVGGRFGARLAGRVSEGRLTLVFCLLVTGVALPVLAVYLPRLW